ncbi:uncharacterized protein TNCV_1790381 [Trichonephila clavipes]|nr:uncharacterized protein TNCV_1790381 [Trichonephila clavipes]
MTFVDPETGAHTNSIEGTRSAIKKGLLKAHVKSQFDSFLAEYMWRRSNGHKMVDENFHDYLASLARVYPPQRKRRTASVWRSSWPFHSFQTVILQILLNNPSSVRSCIIIHQNEVVTNSSSIWADIWIKDLIPISKTSYGSSMEHMQVSVATERDPCPNQDSTTSITVSFNSVGLMVSSALLPPDQ